MEDGKNALERLQYSLGHETRHRRSWNRVEASIRQIPRDHNVLKPVQLSLKPLGLDKNEPFRSNTWLGKLKSRLNCRLVFCLIAVHLVVVHTISNSVYYAIKKKQLSLAFGNLAGLLRALTAAVSLDYFLFNKDAVYDVMDSVNSFRSRFSSTKGQSRIPGKKWCLVVVVLFWCYFWWKVLFPIVFAAHLEPKFYIEMFMYDFSVFHNLSQNFQRLVCCLELFMYQCTVGIKNFVQLVVTCSVGVTCRKMNGLTYAIKNKKEVDCQSLSIWHTDLFALVRKLDRNFRFLYLVWMSEWMASLVLNFPKLITSKKTDNLFANVLSYMDIATTFFVSIFVSVTFSEITSKQADLLYAVHHRVTYHSLATTARNTHLTDTYLICKIGTGKLYMTIFNIVIVTKTFIISLYGAVLTYIMFIAQELQREGF